MFHFPSAKPTPQTHRLVLWKMAEFVQGRSVEHQTPCSDLPSQAISMASIIRSDTVVGRRLSLQVKVQYG